MRVLFADKLPDSARVRLASNGCEVRAEPSLKGEQLTARLAEFDPHVLVVRSTKVHADQLDAAHQLSLIVRAGAGVNTIDVDGASSRGVFVANCPGKNAVAVAELTLGLILALDRRIPDNVSDLRAGYWNKRAYSKASGLRGRTLGILGLGAIGREVARLGQAFGMEVLAWSRSLDEARAAELGVKRYDTPEDVARRSNVLSVHLALTPETRGFVAESIFQEMKPGALFLNTCRAEVVDQAALVRALESPGIRAGLDVFEGEPAYKEGPFEDPIGTHAAVYGTHHIGASTEQAQLAVADEMCRVVETFQATGEVPNCVNLAKAPYTDHTVVVRHRDRVGVLAHVLDVLRGEGINIGEMENRIFRGDEAAAIARLFVRGAPSEAAVEQMLQSADVLAVHVVPNAQEA